jgi:hypothetical protein
MLGTSFQFIVTDVATLLQGHLVRSRKLDIEVKRARGNLLIAPKKKSSDWSSERVRSALSIGRGCQGLLSSSANFGIQSANYPVASLFLHFQPLLLPCSQRATEHERTGPNRLKEGAGAQSAFLPAACASWLASVSFFQESVLLVHFLTSFLRLTQKTNRAYENLFGRPSENSPPTQVFAPWLLPKRRNRAHKNT